MSSPKKSKRKVYLLCIQYHVYINFKPFIKTLGSNLINFVKMWWMVLLCIFGPGQTVSAPHGLCAVSLTGPSAVRNHSYAHFELNNRAFGLWSKQYICLCIDMFLGMIWRTLLCVLGLGQTVSAPIGARCRFDRLVCHDGSVINISIIDFIESS